MIRSNISYSGLFKWTFKDPRTYTYCLSHAGNRYNTIPKRSLRLPLLDRCNFKTQVPTIIKRHQSSEKNSKELSITSALDKVVNQLKNEIPESTKYPLVEELGLNKNKTMELLITYLCIAEAALKNNNQRMMIPLQKVQSIILFLALNQVVRKDGKYHIFNYYRQTFLHQDMLDPTNPINQEQFMELAFNSMFPMNQLYEISALSEEIKKKYTPIGPVLGKGEHNIFAQIYMRRLLNDMKNDNKLVPTLNPRVNILVGGDTLTRGCDSSGIARTMYDMSQLKKFDTNIIIFILNGVSITLPINVEKTKNAILEDFGRYADVIGEWDASDGLGIAKALDYHATPTEKDFGKTKIMFVITNKDSGNANRLAQGHASEPGRSDEENDLYQFILNLLLPFQSGDIDLQTFLNDTRKKADVKYKSKSIAIETRTREDILTLSELKENNGSVIEGDHKILFELGQKTPGKSAYTKAIHELKQKGRILWLGQEEGGVYGDNSNLGDIEQINFVPDEQRITENAVATRKIVEKKLDQDGNPYIVICRGPHWPFQLLAMPTAYEGAKSKYVTGQTGNIIIFVDSGSLVDENDINRYAKVGEKHNRVQFPEEPMVKHITVSSMGELPSVMNTVYDIYRQDFTVVVHLPTKDFTRGVILDTKDNFGYNDVKRFSFEGIENKQTEQIFITYGPITKLVGKEIKARNIKCTLYQLISPSHMPEALKKEIKDKLTSKKGQLILIDPDPGGNLYRLISEFRATFSTSERFNIKPFVENKLGIIPQGFDPIQPTQKDIRDFLNETTHEDSPTRHQQVTVSKPERSNQNPNNIEKQNITFSNATDIEDAITPEFLQDIEFQLSVTEGTEVKAGDPIATYMSDKATVDITAPIDGKVTKLIDMNAISGTINDIAVIEVSSLNASSSNGKEKMIEVGGLIYRWNENSLVK